MPYYFLCAGFFAHLELTPPELPVETEYVSIAGTQAACSLQ